MGITVMWDDPNQTVIRMKLDGHWTLEEFRTANIQAVLLVRSVEHTVYVISDALDTNELPIGMLWQLRAVIGMRPKNWGGGVALTHNNVAKGIVDVLSRVYMGKYGKRLFVAQTEAEANDVIAKWKREDQGADGNPNVL